MTQNRASAYNDLLNQPVLLGSQIIIHFLAHLSMLRVSFWDTMMSFVCPTGGRPRRP